MRNAFLAMCNLADAGHWHWRIGCTPCLCCHFRNGLRLLAQGLHADSDEWARTATELYLRTRPTALTFDEQVALCDIVSEVDIADLQESCVFPDFLGYLGLVLHETKEAEQETGLLTRSLLPKLFAAIDDPLDRESLQGKFTDGRRLRWQDLEDFEEPLRPAWRSRAAG